MANLEQAKKAVKEHGVKGFRKLRLKRECYTIGKQCVQIEKFKGISLINALEKAGFRVQQKDILLNLADQGFLDVITIER